MPKRGAEVTRQRLPHTEPSFAVFDREAARYDAWFESERGRAIFASEVLCLRRLAAGLPRPWLEVGVGTGRFAEALEMDMGVDPASGALRYAEKRGVKVLPGLGEALPFGDGKFGAVFAIVTLCFADDPTELFRESARVAREGGGVVLGIVPAEGPWGRFYAAKGGTGHTFYSEARFFTLDELKQLARGAGLRPERSASTLFQEPGRSSYEIEPPREGEDEGAGFVAVLCRRDGEAPAKEAARLICMMDNVEVSEENPHCQHPSSQCRFRELCPVMEVIRAREGSERG